MIATLTVTTLLALNNYCDDGGDAAGKARGMAGYRPHAALTLAAAATTQGAATTAAPAAATPTASTAAAAAAAAAAATNTTTPRRRPPSWRTRSSTSRTPPPLDVSSDSVHCNALTQSSTVSYAFSCHTIDTCEKMLSQHRPCPYLIPILAVPAGSVPAGSSDDDNKTASPTPSSSSVPLC